MIVFRFTTSGFQKYPSRVFIIIYLFIYLSFIDVHGGVLTLQSLILKANHGETIHRIKLKFQVCIY